MWQFVSFDFFFSFLVAFCSHLVNQKALMNAILVENITQIQCTRVFLKFCIVFNMFKKFFVEIYNLEFKSVDF